MKWKPQVINCPVCSERVEVYEICENCGWQNSGAKEGENSPPGPETITLGEAKRRFKENPEKYIVENRIVIDDDE
ncbi:MAG: CPCC family cysteine-rich protein [Culicoidibacterales bacterium]